LIYNFRSGLKTAQSKTPAENLPAFCSLIASFLPG